MDDTISRQAAIDAIEITPFDDYGDYMRARELIEQLPSAQPEIIRCKDCKHYVLHRLFGRTQGWCERLCDEFDKSLAMGTEDNDFCSYAERRTDG